MEEERRAEIRLNGARSERKGNGRAKGGAQFTTRGSPIRREKRHGILLSIIFFPSPLPASPRNPMLLIKMQMSRQFRNF